jgi:hypothetical protein
MIRWLPEKNTFARSILRHAASEEEVKKIARAVAREFGVAEIDRWTSHVLTVPAGPKWDFDRVQRLPFFRYFRAAKNSLIDKKLIEVPGPGRIRVTDAGRAVLAAWEAAM